MEPCSKKHGGITLLRGASGEAGKTSMCAAANPDELSFVEQEEMEIISEGDGDGWIKARNYKGEEGYIPQNYVEIVESQPAGASGESFSSVDYRVETSDDAEAVGAVEPEAGEQPPEAEAVQQADEVVPPSDFPATLALPGEVHLSTTYCRAIYDYEPTCADELGFYEGQVIRILRTVVHDGVDDGWWEGELEGRTGIFPSLMVEALKVTGEPQTPMVGDDEAPRDHRVVFRPYLTSRGKKHRIWLIRVHVNSQPE
ncbi:hypothetical protein HPB48_009455 [Haemaphysalis longicornis]|uniref:SH3 domain-containing protein n=1 Tax=Haemaphysalis longicornis TaxID=44386 RepID=A0A9J6GDE2_HAELO|nr:hypothetical protein HPB48_009455 [Haemaphysalis longicornis]